MMRSSITHTSSFLPGGYNMEEVTNLAGTKANLAFEFERANQTKRLTAVVRLPESEAGGVGLSAGWQGQVEEQGVGGSWEVKLIQHQPADSSVHGVLQQDRMGTLRDT